jgi:CRISPR system Cascade subunit CasD
MAILLLRLCGPMQSWGTQSRFTNRDTELEPSKSGVIGLLCAASGIPRDDVTGLKKLAGLKMGVRVDREGKMERDYHTAQNVVKAGGGIKPTELSDRFYLADACFLVGLQGSINLLKELYEAVQKPVWQLFLGRKSFVPGLPVWLEDSFKPDADNLKKALSEYPYLCDERPWDDSNHKLRLEFETDYGIGEIVRQDQPESFALGMRHFGLRYVTVDWVERRALPSPKEDLCIFLS